jgi:hypothetical protein
MCAFHPKGKKLLKPIDLSIHSTKLQALDLDYAEKYCSASAAPGLPSYTDLAGRTSQRHPAWTAFTSPDATIRTLLKDSIAYTFEGTPENVADFGELALGVASIWVAHLTNAGNDGIKGNGGDATARAAYDARYADGVEADPDNAIVARLFGEDALHALVQVTLGQ